MTHETKLIDLTAVHVTREMYRQEDDPLADESFKRRITEVKTDEQRERQSERLLKVRAA